MPAWLNGDFVLKFCALAVMSALAFVGKVEPTALVAFLGGAVLGVPGWVRAKGEVAK